MDATGRAVRSSLRARAGRFLPAPVLTTAEDHGREPRTTRDRIVDSVCVLVAALFGVLLFGAVYDARTQPVPDPLLLADLALGSASILAVWWRRRYPIGIAAFTALAGCLSAGAAAAAAITLFTVAVHRRPAVAVWLGGLNLAVAALFPLIRPQQNPYWQDLLFGALFIAIVIAWGLFVRARRQLVATLRERAERAEAEQRALAEQARVAERTRIAREMHDVLAHRISLLALHAGGLELRPDLPADDVRETARLLRATAHQALEELRGVIGVLRDGNGEDAAPAAPQPTLRDIPRLVADTRRAGAKVNFTMTVPPGPTPPDALGRDAYRIVQEALTNVAKHARGTATSVQVSGAPGAGLHVDVRNKLPLAGNQTYLPGSGRGLIGLQERVTLAGGTLRHGPTDDGDFVVDARLAWP